MILSSFRHLLRNKVATLINITGLTLAMTVTFFMLQYLNYELSYDTYLPEHEQIYRISTEHVSQQRHTAETFYGVSDWITETFPEVAFSTRFYRIPASAGILLQLDGKLYNERNHLYADKNFFKVFPSLLIAGNATSCLVDPNSVVLSNRIAMKIFGSTDVIGRTMTDPERKEGLLSVTGIMHETPLNSHFDADVVRPYEWIPGLGDEWKSTSWTYVLLRKDVDVTSLTSKLNASIKSQLDEPGRDVKLSLQQLSSIHLQSNLEGEIKNPGNILNIYVIGGAVVLLMLVAWINYINLSTARLIKRLKETAIRRIIGASKKSLFFRFLTENLITTGCALLFAAVIISIGYPSFQSITNIHTALSFEVRWLWTGTALLLLVCTMLAVAYQSISVVRINPVYSLKGQLRSSINNSLLKKALLTFQFVASLSLMALVTTAFFQLDFMRTANASFDYNHVFTVYNPANYTYSERINRAEGNDAFKNKLQQSPHIERYTTSSAIPGEPIGFTYTDLAKKSLSDPDRQVHYKVMYIDYDFIPLFGLQLLAGRNYSAEYSDENCLVLTESAIHELGFTSAQEAIDKSIFFMEEDWDQWKIIGVVKDYRHESVKSPAYPGIFRLHRNQGQMVFYSVKVADDASSIDALEATRNAWNEVWPGKPFDYFFMDVHYDQQFKEEITFSKVFLLFSVVSVLIACLGVLGMCIYEVNSRIKEIGIRNVLGAKLSNIIILLSKDNLKILIVSLIISSPIAYGISSAWLSNYPERIQFNALYVIAPFVVMMILVAMVSWTQVFQAAGTNPVDSLKEE